MAPPQIKKKVNIMSDLEKDFDVIAAQINSKIAEAVAALKEVNRLKDEAELPALICANWIAENMECDSSMSRAELNQKLDQLSKKLEKIDVHQLESELCNAGWSTSSSYC